MLILWVGLSAKYSKAGGILPALDTSTLSGKLVSEIELSLPQYTFKRVNLVSFPPLNKDGKLRYPTISECNNEFSNFWTNLQNTKPKIIFMLGDRVSKYLIKKIDMQLFEKNIYLFNQIYFISIEHPSYIMVYKKQYKQIYIDKINQLTTKFYSR